MKPIPRERRFHADRSGSRGRTERGARPQRAWPSGEDRKPAHLEHLSVVLDSFLYESGIRESLDRLGVLDDWARVVGPRISEVTRPVEVQRETLVVEVSSSAWLNELAMMKVSILEELNRGVERPPIEGIRFRLAEQ